MFSIAAAAILLVLTTRYPAACAQAVQQGMTLCLTRAIPSLFPFFVASCLTIHSGLASALSHLFSPLLRRLRLPSCSSAALLLGFLGGYPTGAQTVSELLNSGQCSKKDANRLILFCNNTGPAFLIGMCGSTLFQSVRAGLFLYAVHIASACLIGLLFGRTQETDSDLNPSVSPVRLTECLTHSIRQAGIITLTVTSFILYFHVLLSLLSETGLLSHMTAGLGTLLPLSSSGIQALLVGSMELTSGLSLLASASLPPPAELLCCSGLCAFGGLCVLFQSAAAAPQLKFSRIFLGKLLHAGVAIALTAVLLPLSGL
ncbi:MAG: nucleoside recognition domain-containing protein [Butyricicoccus sp.]